MMKLVVKKLMLSSSKDSQRRCTAKGLCPLDPRPPGALPGAHSARDIL